MAFAFQRTVNLIFAILVADQPFPAAFVELGRGRWRCKIVARDELAYAAGIDAAKADIAAGRLVYRWAGHAGHWGHWIVTQFAERFGVRVNDGFGVCFVTASSLSFDEGYNAVLAAAIDGQHGDGAFEALFRESRQQTEETLRAAKKSWLEMHRDAESDGAHRLI